MAAQDKTEQELVNALQSKSKQGYELIYRSYGPALFGIISKIVRNETAAEDVLQDCFVKIWQNIEHYDASKGTLFTWLCNIGRNKAIDYLRSKHVKYQIQNPDAIVLYAESASESMQVDHIGLKEVVNKLKPELRQVLDAIYFGGFTHEEAAKELELPLGTVKTRIRTAVSQLRELLMVQAGGR